MTSPTANVPQFQLPSIHPQGTIQSPGDLGALGQGLSGLPQILMALQQQQLERQRNAIYQKQVEGTLAQQQARQAWEEQQARQSAADNAALGQFASILNAPSFPGVAQQSVPTGLPGMPNIQLPNVPSQEVDPDRLIGQLGAQVPRLVPEAIKQNKERIGELRANKEQAKVQSAFEGWTQSDRTPEATIAALKKTPPNRQSELAKLINEVMPPGTWNLVPSDGKWIAVNSANQKIWDTGRKADEKGGVTVNVNPTQSMRGALTGLAGNALEEISSLREGGYDPTAESGLVKLGGKLPMVGDFVAEAGLSSEGKRYYNAVNEIMSSWLRLTSGATVTEADIRDEARKLTISFFTDKKGLAQKERFLSLRYSAMQRASEGGEVGKLPIPKNWGQFTGIVNKYMTDYERFAAEADSLRQKP